MSNKHTKIQDWDDISQHDVFTSTRFSKGLPREYEVCWANDECEYKVPGKYVFTKEAFQVAWSRAKIHSKLLERLKGNYYIKVCIPCGHINVSNYMRPLGDKAYIKELNSYAFDVPRFVGDCNYLYFSIPSWLGTMIPKRLKYRGITYKKLPTWDKPGWAEKESE